ncbi:MAG: 6-bladed beta-propeller [Planctomycetota bacterium]
MIPIFRCLPLLLLASSLAAQAPPTPAQKPAAPASDPELIVGKDAQRFRWLGDWARVPEGAALGNTHGAIVIDAAGLVYVNTDTESAVMVFKPDGTFVKAWGKEFKGGTHGMLIHGPPDKQEMILAHTSRHEVVGTTLDGNVLWTIPWPQESGVYASAGEYAPTAVALAPDGRLFVADGYGKSWVHIYDKDRKYLSSFGGPGTEPGKFQTPHGLWIDTVHQPARLIVADRANHRLQIFDLDAKLVSVVDHDLRLPCGFSQHKDLFAVADLGGRVTLFDKDFKLIEQLCDQPDESLRAQNGVARERFKRGEFISPHSVRFDADGNLYVMDWVSTGRVTKLEAVR